MYANKLVKTNQNLLLYLKIFFVQLYDTFLSIESYKSLYQNYFIKKFILSIFPKYCQVALLVLMSYIINYYFCLKIKHK